jgi:hypothetical protein
MANPASRAALRNLRTDGVPPFIVVNTHRKINVWGKKKPLLLTRNGFFRLKSFVGTR